MRFTIARRCPVLNCVTLRYRSTSICDGSLLAWSVVHQRNVLWRWSIHRLLLHLSYQLRHSIAVEWYRSVRSCVGLWLWAEFCHHDNHDAVCRCDLHFSANQRWIRQKGIMYISILCSIGFAVVNVTGDLKNLFNSSLHFHFLLCRITRYSFQAQRCGVL